MNFHWITIGFLLKIHDLMDAPLSAKLDWKNHTPIPPHFLPNWQWSYAAKAVILYCKKQPNFYSMNTSQTLRTNIIKCLSDRGLSQIQLAVSSQLHESVISRILSGKREINVYHLDKIATALNLSITSLLYYPEEVLIAHKTNHQISIPLYEHLWYHWC